MNEGETLLQFVNRAGDREDFFWEYIHIDMFESYSMQGRFEYLENTMLDSVINRISGKFKPPKNPEKDETSKEKKADIIPMNRKPPK